MGLIIEPDTENPESNLHPKNWLDRPHILHNRKTGKYVCWLKFSGEIGCFGIMTADSLSGPYTMVHDNFRPGGKAVGDFDLAVDEDSGKAYIYFEYDHYGVAAFELNEDYTDVVGEAACFYEGLKAPFTREGVTLFTRNGLHYLITSGMTGYVPNQSQTAVFKEWRGPIEIQGNPHRDDDSGASFNSQISAVFKHPKKKDLYIALADRWVPGYLMTKEKTDVVTRVIAAQFDDNYQVTQEEMMQIVDVSLLGNHDTSISEYIWLPIQFEGDKAVIEWKDGWSIEDYE